MPIALIYTTLPTRDEALSIARQLLEERLVACVHLAAPHTAIYRWQGSIEETAEHALWCKTTDLLSAQAVARIAALHPYECPAILAMDAAASHPLYAAWVESEVDTAQA